MKMNIKIQQEQTNWVTLNDEMETIVEIDINNGNWKYWETHQETDEKTSLTINNITKSHYLSLPVKDAYPFYDYEKAREDNELIVTDAMVRTYDSLIDYLNNRINNVKEDYKKHGWTKSEFTIVLFDLATNKFRDDVTANIVYEKESLCEVIITVVE